MKKRLEDIRADSLEELLEKAKEAGGIVIRPAPDGGVTVNGVGLWPDGPKDDKGYVYGTKGNWTARYNFETRAAEATFHPDPDVDTDNGSTVVFLLMLSICIAALALLWWFFS